MSKLQVCKRIHLQQSFVHGQAIENESSLLHPTTEGIYSYTQITDRYNNAEALEIVLRR
jgi:hypothetical protein